MSAAGYRRVAADVRQFADRAPGEAIALVDDAITAQLRADTGDGSFSHGPDLGRATTRTTKRQGEAEVQADGSRRVWGILEGGTSGHTVTASAGRVLRTPFGPRRSVTVSGVAARETFTKSCAKGMEEAARKLQDDWAALG